MVAAGFIADSNYKFPDWPCANPLVGPHYKNVPACVCELKVKALSLIKAGSH